MARRAPRGAARDLRKTRIAVVACALGAAGCLFAAYFERTNTDSVLNWGGWGVLLAAVAVLAGSRTFGSRPLRSFGAGAWFCVAAGGAFLAFFGRNAPTVKSSYRGAMQGPLTLGIACLLLPVGLWLMIRRPPQDWEREHGEKDPAQP